MSKRFLKCRYCSWRGTLINGNADNVFGRLYHHIADKHPEQHEELQEWRETSARELKEIEEDLLSFD